MKKKILAICIVTMLLSVAILPVMTGCTSRANTLRVYSWTDYIDDTLIEEFETYYQQVTGEKIKVDYQAFDISETMYSKIATKHSDYDVVCPSDYMLERMINEDLLLKLEKDLSQYAGVDESGNAIAIEDYRSNIADFLLSGNGYFECDPTNEYGIPYMWGTMGIVYNKDYEGIEDILAEEGWGILWDSRFNQKIEMKDSVRDSYIAASLYTFEDEINNGTMTVSEAINNKTEIERVKANLLNQKSLVLEYETDKGKTHIADGTIDLLLQWSGDAVWAMSEEFQLEELQLSEMANLGYYVPEVGSNLWADYWCIPKYSVNQKAANMWINFLCREDCAVKNMEYIGYTSAVASDATLEYAVTGETGTDDLSYMFGDAGKNVTIADVAQFPTIEVLTRCAVMRDFGSDTQLFNDLWTSVKNK